MEIKKMLSDEALPPKGERIGWVDIMKGLLIIFMVIGHTGGPFPITIYLFHMPALFMLSGLTYRGQRYGLGEYVIRQVQNVLLPTLLINFLYILFYVAADFLGYYSVFQAGDPRSLTDWLYLLFRWLGTPDFGGATWFLFVLFEAAVVCRLLTGIAVCLKKERFTWVGMLALGCVGWYLVSVQRTLPYYFDLTLLACFFFGVGIAISQYRLLEKMDARILLPLAILSTLFFAQFYFAGQLPMNWPTRAFANPVIQTVSCFAATYLCQQCAVAFQQMPLGRYLRWLGQHTYCVVATHFVMFRILFGLGVWSGNLPSAYLQNLTPTGDMTTYGRWILIAAFAIAGCSALAWLSEKNPVTNYVLNAKTTVRHKKKEVA